MKRETRVLVVLYLLLLVAVVIPLIPYPTGLYYQFPEYRWLTIVEYLRTIIWNVILRRIVVV